MWTNVFRIGELQTVSWFQFLPVEPDPSSLPEKRLKAEQKDASTHLILSAHLQLQNEGLLSTWTNSFVGPWDPSQGAHNPDEKIKLWLFLPGRHSSIIETAHAAVSKLRVVGNGLWLAPGDSEEVGVALSQALRNSIERALRGLSYGRFGNVFTRCHPFTSSVRRPQPTIEFSFAATEEAIYVHAVISAKHIRGLCSGDMDRLLWHCSSHSVRDGIPVIVAPTGMRGRLTGCCPTDLVKHVYNSKLKTSNGFAIGSHMAQSSSGQVRGQRCFVEVTLGCRSLYSDNVMGLNNNQNTNALNGQDEEPQLIPSGRIPQKHGMLDQLPIMERTFIYPVESVIIPVMHRALARSSNKSLWLRNWIGTSLSEIWPLWNFTDCSQLELCLALGNSVGAEPFSGMGVEYNRMGSQKQYNSSSNSINSSISSISRTSSENDGAMGAGADDLEADADSLTCRQSSLSSKRQRENDGLWKVSQRPRTGLTETSVQTGTMLSATIQDAFMSDYSLAEVDNSDSLRAQSAQVGSQWDWDDDDGGIGMDIQTLLSEFGGFGDFFEDDLLAFGEPPGTAESQALIFPAADFGDITDSPCNGVVDASEQKISQTPLPSMERLNQQMVSPTEDILTTKTDVPMDTGSLASAGSVQSSGKFDYLTKAEAIMTFAPEYAPVDSTASDFSTSVFKSPYLPRSKMVESFNAISNSYTYNATPPSCMETAEEKSEKHDGISSIKSLKLYTHVASGIEKKNERSTINDVPSSNGEVSSSITGSKTLNASIPLTKKIEYMSESGGLLFPAKTVFASELECMIYQTSMCKVRHTLLSLRCKVPTGLKNSISDLVQGESNLKPEIMTVKHEPRKKDNIPVRLAGDIDGVQDGLFTAEVGVWRSVGVPKVTKPSRVSENLASLPLGTSNDESLNFHGQKQPLHDLVDAMSFLVQQSVCFVDFSLDTNDGYGSFYWLGIQEQRRRNFACDPSMIHAGCGGLLSMCHSLDIAGADLIDPLSADVQASSVITLLLSDIKLALKTAFGSLDGPLSVIDWCRGCSHFGDLGTPGDVNECKDSSGVFSLVREPISPSQSTSGSSSTRERARIDESSQRRLNQEMFTAELDQQKGFARGRPTIMVLPLPAILVGYQDDWLKTSVNSLRLWEKAPLEPYASPKPVTYYALCPDIELLTSAAVDFFQQLGTVYEICKLGSHSPQLNGGQMESCPGTTLSSGLMLVDCPEQVKISINHLNVFSSINDYFLSLSKSWNPKDFTRSLTKIIKDIKLTPSSWANQKENSSGPCTVVYVICPFPEPMTILQTLVECSAALGSVVNSTDKERQSLLYSQISKALNHTAAVDEASASNVLMLSGFSVPQLVLQIITVETLLRAYRPISELAVLKDIAFTVYNKARRVPRAASNSDMFQTSFSGRSQPVLMHVAIPGLSKDCLAPRMSGTSLTREGEIDSALRPGSWDSSWQTSRIAGLSGEQIRSADISGVNDGTRFLFEPLFILAEPGSVENGTLPTFFGSPISESSSMRSTEDTGGIYMQNPTSGTTDIGTTCMVDGSEHENKAPSLHCSYGWTEDWRWLLCIWTDARGEFLDSCIFPFGGISSRQDTKVLQTIFIQILQQGCQILSSCSDAGLVRPRDIIITRVGCFFELECQEWQSAIFAFGGNDVKKWPLQLRRSAPDAIQSSNNGSSLQQHDLVMIQERNLPTSPGTSLYSPHSKSSFNKSGMGQPNSKKQLLVGQTGPDSSKGSSLQLVQSISLVGISVDHSLHLILQTDTSSSGGTQSSSSSVTSYLEGFSPLKSLGSMQASYLLVPSPNMRCLPPLPLHLPTCLTSESPPLAHLLHSKGSALPLATGYVVSKTVPSMRQDMGDSTREDWPSILSVSLIDHYGGNVQDRMIRGTANGSVLKQVRSLTPEVINKDYELETHMVLESVAAELHSLSWMTVSPVYLERRTSLPFHCDMLLRLRRLLHYADKELSKPPENSQV